SRLGLAPCEVPITVTESGKPVVSKDLHFNVSHSGDLIALAVCTERAVGIDVERRRHVARVDALIGRWLTASEQREVTRLLHGGASESDAFLRIWSAKEARLKALGVGISGANTADVRSVLAVQIDDLLLSSGKDTSGYFAS